jgi:hypothetical protein
MGGPKIGESWERFEWNFKRKLNFLLGGFGQIQFSYLHLPISFIILKFQFNINKYLKSIIHYIYFQNDNN